MVNWVKITWIFAFAYIAYIFLAKVPVIQSAPIFTATLAFLLFIVIYLLHSYANFGPRKATVFLACAVVVSYAAEYIGVETGLPFGHYVYSSSLAPFIGPVPAIIPLLWAALAYFCVIAVPNYIYAALLMVLVDVSLDPRYALSLWRWSGPAPYFYGVPLLNFAGWFVVSLAIYYAYKVSSKQSSARLFTRLGLVFYFLFGVNNSITDAESGLVGVALVSATLFALTFALLFVFVKVKEPRQLVTAA
jgi:uncharacterized membrane protein